MPTSIMCRNSSVCSLAYETNQTVSVSFLETKFHGFGFQKTNTIAFDSSSQMVVSYSQHFSGQPFQLPLSTVTLLTDASMFARGACLGKEMVQGIWSPEERKLHIHVN